MPNSPKNIELPESPEERTNSVSSLTESNDSARSENKVPLSPQNNSSKSNILSASGPEKIAHRLLDLQSAIIELINIERFIALPKDAPHDYENDAEHSYSLAIMAWYLSSYFPELDKDTTVRYALAHDWVEIHAGDMMAIGRTQLQQEEKDAKELEAIKTLKSEWPDFPDMTASVEAYFHQTDDEAVFVRTLDKLMGTLVNILSGGQIWHEKGINRDELIANKNEKTKGHAGLHEVWEVLRQHLLDHPEYFPEKP